MKGSNIEMNKANAFQVFQSVFEETMKKDNFLLKDKISYYSIDYKNMWIKKLSLNLWDNGRLFRIFVNIHLFTDEYWPSLTKNLEHSYDISKMHPAPNPLWKGFEKKEQAFFTLEPYMPTVNSIERAYQHYLEWVREPFVSCKQFAEALKHRAVIQAMEVPVMADELDRLNAYVYIGDTPNAMLSAYRYRNELMRNIESFVNLVEQGEGTEFILTHYKNSLVDLRKRLDDIVKVIYQLAKNDTAQLIKSIKDRVAKRKEEVLNLFGTN